MGRNTRTTAAGAFAAVLIAATTAAAGGGVTPGQKCEAGKLGATGKYSLCVLKAGKKFVITGDAALYSSLLAGCETPYSSKWSALEANATAGGSSCPSEGDATAIQDYMDSCVTDISGALAGGTLPDCPGDLATCNTNLGTCNGNLGTCTTNYAACSSDLATCSAGTAAAGEVLTGRTFSSSNGIGLTGTMPNNGSVTLTPTTFDQPIAAGYHSGLGACAGDPDLVPANIANGASIFGVTSDGSVVNTSSGDAVAGDLRSGKKAWVDGSEVTGTVTTGSNVTGGDGSLVMTIPNGIYEGSKTATAGDSDLAPENIKDGVSIFGVLGTFTLGGAPTPGAQPLQTGQTTCYDDGGSLIDCANTKLDGELQRGVARAFTNNGDGTVTDDATQLQWERLSDDNGADQDGIHDWDNAYSISEAIDIKIAYLNSHNFAGHSDWRLPNQTELMTLVNFGAINPATYPQFDTSCAPGCTVANCTCTQPGNYWSSTAYLFDPSAGWTVNFIDGGPGAQLKVGGNYVRAVRTAS